jgi:hypothetical protein
MLYSAFRVTVHRAVLTFAAMLIVTAATPALAIDGRTAVGVCIDSTASGARCAWSVNDKGEIDICNKSGCVYCPSATGDCTVAAKGRPRPTRTLPVGTTVKTSVLDVEITGKPFLGPILGFRCPAGTLPCPGHGCQPKDDKCTPVR